MQGLPLDWRSRPATRTGSSRGSRRPARITAIPCTGRGTPRSPPPDVAPRPTVPRAVPSTIRGGARRTGQRRGFTCRGRPIWIVGRLGRRLPWGGHRRLGRGRSNPAPNQGPGAGGIESPRRRALSECGPEQGLPQSVGGRGLMAPRQAALATVPSGMRSGAGPPARHAAQHAGRLSWPGIAGIQRPPSSLESPVKGRGSLGRAEPPRNRMSGSPTRPGPAAGTSPPPSTSARRTGSPPRDRSPADPPPHAGGGPDRQALEMPTVRIRVADPRDAPKPVGRQEPGEAGE
jgi:hypothetical protein